MMNRLDDACLWARIRLYRARENVKEFFASQDGVSNVVATIIVLLITVLLIAAFWDRLQSWVKGIMDSIFNESFDGSKLGGGV